MTSAETGWTMALSFIFAVLVVVLVSYAVYNDDFAPLIRAFESRQRHKQEMAKMKLRAELIKKGVDPEYVAFMQREVEK